MHKLDICFRWPGCVFHGFNEKFFLGGWHPSSMLRVKIKGFENCLAPNTIFGNNWFLISSQADNNFRDTGLLHSKVGRSGEYSEAMLFSGYILDPCIHSFSPSEKIFNYFKKKTDSSYNGVFSLARISEFGKKLEIRTDAFGISPLYYRIYKTMVLFSSNPRFLRFDNDTPDYISWRCLVQSRFISSDRTLSNEVKRFPAGSVMYNDGCEIKTSSWFDYSTLPVGETKIDEKAIVEIENSFRSAVSKCLRLENGKYFLPLSSGHDSRRILAILNDLEVDFESATVRVFQKGCRDLDAKFSSLMAQDFGFKHKVINLPSLSEYVQNDWQRRVILDAESSLHTWYISLLKALPSKPSIVFDGLGGDVLGETGFEVINFHKGDHVQKINQISKYAINDHFNDVFNLKNMPSSYDVRQDICNYIRNIPDSLIFSDLAFLLLRTRRSISIGVQQLLPMSHIVVFPYLDLDFVRTALHYSPFDKLQKSIQDRCLEKYWPKYYSYGGSRNIPDGTPIVGVHLYNSQLVARFTRLRNEILSQGGVLNFNSLLSKKAKLIFLCSCISEKALYGREWYLMGLMELEARQSRQVFCLEIKTGSTD